MPSDDDRTTAELLAGRTFRVTSIGGAPALASPTAVLTFDEQGRVHGRATINRVNGAYRVEGDELLCGPLMSTMMAGPADAMRQEQDLLAALGAPLLVRAVGAGLELVTADGVAVVLQEDGGEEVVT